MKAIHRKTLLGLAVVAGAAVLSGLIPATASAGTTPYHSYSISCPKLGYWGNRIKAFPMRLDVQPGVGVSIVDGTGINRPTTDQFIYYKVWAYSYKYGQWYGSTFKRVNDGTPNTPEVYDRGLQSWIAAGMGFDNDDLSVGANEVSLSPNTGTGTWKIAVETYWAPPFTTYLTSFLTSPSPAAGGLDTIDYATNTCTF